MMIELLMVSVIMPMVETLGVTLTVIILLGAIGLGAWGAYYLAEMAADFFLLQGGSSVGRTRWTKAELKTREAEIRADSMSDGELRDWLNAHPKDAIAVDALCRRLKKSGNLEAYARERERYLSLNPEIEVDRLCMHYHKLADLYQGPFGHPEHARELLNRFIELHPDSKEAKLTRERVERLSQMAATSRP